MLPAVVAVAVVGAGIGAVAVTRPWEATPEAGDHTVHQTPGEHSPPAQPSSPPPTSVPAPDNGPSPSASPSEDVGQQALTACRAKVAAGDAVIEEGKVGVGHWNEHVQAQTDANAGKINLDQLNAIFARTRLAGPADLQRYDAALATYTGLTGGCAPVNGAAPAIANQLAACQQRADAQPTVLRTTAAAMADWRQHQADMARSRHEHVPDAQNVWNKAWAAAPKNLNPWKAAVGAYRPPAC